MKKVRNILIYIGWIILLFLYFHFTPDRIELLVGAFCTGVTVRILIEMLIEYLDE